MKNLKKVEIAVLAVVLAAGVIGIFSLATTHAEGVHSLSPLPKKLLIVGNGPGITDQSVKPTNETIMRPMIPSDRAIYFYAPNSGPTNYRISIYPATLTNQSGVEKIILEQDALGEEFFVVPSGGLAFFPGGTNVYVPKLGMVNKVDYRFKSSSFTNVPDMILAIKISGTAAEDTNTRTYEGMSLITIDGPADGEIE
jgi:hypothetical protein